MGLGTNIIRKPYPYLFQSAQNCPLDTWDYLDSFCLLYQKPSTAGTASRHNSGPWQPIPCGVKKRFLFHVHSISHSSVFFLSHVQILLGMKVNLFVCLIDGPSKIHILHQQKAQRYVGLNGVLASLTCQYCSVFTAKYHYKTNKLASSETQVMFRMEELSLEKHVNSYIILTFHGVSSNLQGLRH